MGIREAIREHQQHMGWFRRVALHMHSPASRDWEDGSLEPGRGRDALLADPAAFVAHLDERFDLVAIADHMKSGYACKCCLASQHCVVLPGIELNVRFSEPFGSVRMHFVAVFPAGHSPERIAALFGGSPSIPDDEDRTGQEEIVTPGLAQLVKAVRGVGGILVAAHVDNGHRSVFRDQGGGP